MYVWIEPNWRQFVAEAKEIQELQCLRFAFEAHESGLVDFRDKELQRAKMFRMEAQEYIDNSGKP
jgi:hypothetical protein